MFCSIIALLAAPLVVSGGASIDYQPSPLQNTDGTLMVAFERLTPPGQGFIGDIMVTTSNDTGSTWSTPLVIADGPANQRHPALVHVPSGGYRVFYLSDEEGGYGIFSAFSSDGLSWTEEGGLELGWSSGNFGNPTVSAEGDTALVISYDKFFGQGGFVARSTDGGLTWDTEMRRINAKGRLNRIIRHPDGTWLCAWQETGGGTVVNIFASYSTDLITWAPSESLTVNHNGHDAMPFMDENGTAWIYYAKHQGSVYEVMRREVPAWGSYGTELPVYIDEHNSTQPHPLLLLDGRTALFWGSWWNSYNQSDVMMEILDFTGVQNGENGEPSRISLSVGPSPFSGVLSMEVDSPAGSGTITIIDLAGREMAEIAQGRDLQGDHVWSPGHDVPAGVYLVVASTEQEVQSRPCIYLPQ